MKKLILMSMMAVFCLTTVNAQKTVVSQNKDQKVFDVVEQMPEYPGGMQAMLDYLSANIKYPADALKQKVEGRVIASFVVETDGSVSDIKLHKKVFPSLDSEAVRVIEGMPRWIPGKQKGKAVRVKYTIPVIFRLK
jgi:protein TonB